ncbi:hypothetical protein [Streptomyces sp. SAS_270]|uniref:hypothetical protein n=1 Tax=Streptomyces sp. SAS_270 TaxID=3412748 RepID=UPI00403CB53E
MRPVVFVDTSVLLNLLRVPRKDQDHERVAEQLKKIRQTCDLVLPVTAIIETGNHIAQLKDGAARGTCAEGLAGMLRLSIAGRAPWALNTVAWDKEFLQTLLDGAGTGATLVELARAKRGCGDLSILTEVARYRARTSGLRLLVWTLDSQLASYSEPPPG